MTSFFCAGFDRIWKSYIRELWIIKNHSSDHEVYNGIIFDDAVPLSLSPRANKLFFSSSSQQLLHAAVITYLLYRVRFTRLQHIVTASVDEIFFTSETFNEYEGKMLYWEHSYFIHPHYIIKCCISQQALLAAHWSWEWERVRLLWVFFLYKSPRFPINHSSLWSIAVLLCACERKKEKKIVKREPNSLFINFPFPSPHATARSKSQRIGFAN